MILTLKKIIINVFKKNIARHCLRKCLKNMFVTRQVKTMCLLTLPWTRTGTVYKTSRMTQAHGPAPYARVPTFSRWTLWCDVMCHPVRLVTRCPIEHIHTASRDAPKHTRHCTTLAGTRWTRARTLPASRDPTEPAAGRGNTRCPFFGRAWCDETATHRRARCGVDVRRTFPVTF